jgi:hypothetical protein
MYAGLQASAGILICAISVLSVTFSSPLTWETSTTNYVGSPDEDSLVAAREVHRQIGTSLESVPQRWDVSEHDGNVIVRLKSPNGWRDVNLDRISGEMEIRATRWDVVRYLSVMHQKSFGSRHWGDSPWLWAWAAYIELTLLALFVLPISGFYIWLIGRSHERLAILSVFLSTASMSLLWFLIR